MLDVEEAEPEVAGQVTEEQRSENLLLEEPF